MLKKYLSICKKINHAMELFFESWTRYVIKHTTLIMAVSLFIVLGFAAGFARLEERNQTSRLYYPQNTEAWNELDATETSFNHYIFNNNFMLLFPNKDSKNKTVSYNNVVRDDILKFALEVHNEIIKASTTYNGKIITLRHICVMVNNQCLYANALEVFNYNRSKINNSGAVLKTAYSDISKVLHGGRNFMSLTPELFGRFDVSSDKLTATAIRFVYRTHWGKTLELYKRNIAISKVMEDVYKKYKTIADNKGFQLQYETERTGDDEGDKISGANVVLGGIAITLMLTLCSLLTIRLRDPVGGHLLLSIGGIFSIIIGIGGAFGLVALSGQPYVAFLGVLPFLTLAVGIDDMFIIIDEVDSLNSSITGTERLVIAIKHVGASITMTSVTDIIAFIITATSDLPSIRWFCIYAAVSITFTYLMMISFFLCLFSYDIKRIEKGKRDIVPCLIVTGRTIDPWGQRVVTVSEKVCGFSSVFLFQYISFSLL